MHGRIERVAAVGAVDRSSVGHQLPDGRARERACRAWRPLFQVSHTTFWEEPRPNRPKKPTFHPGLLSRPSFPARPSSLRDEVGDVANDDEQPSHSVRPSRESRSAVSPRGAAWGWTDGRRRTCPPLLLYRRCALHFVAAE